MIRLKLFCIRTIIEFLNSGDIFQIVGFKNQKIQLVIKPWKETILILHKLWGFTPTYTDSEIIAQQIINFPDTSVLERFITHGINMQIRTSKILIGILFKSNNTLKYLACITYLKGIINNLPPFKVKCTIQFLDDVDAKQFFEINDGKEKRIVTVVNITDKEINSILD